MEEVLSLLSVPLSEARKEKIFMNKKRNIIIFVIILVLIIGTVVGISLYLNNLKYKYELSTIQDNEIQYYKLEQDGKYGVIDKNGTVVLQPTYASIDIPNPTKAVFIKSDDGQNYSAVDANGSPLFTDYDSVEAISINSITSNIPYEKTVLKYKIGGLYGIMDFDGNEITSNIYNSITNIDYKEGNLRVEQNGSYGVINIKGTTVLKPEYDAIMADGYYEEGTKYDNAGFVLRIVTDDGYRFGYADRTGKIILDTLYNEITRLNDIEGKEAYLVTSLNGRYGVYKNNEEILANEYTDISFDSNNNLLIVEKDQAQGVVDLQGNNIVPIDYDSIIIGGKYIDAQKGEETVVFDAEGNNLDTDIISYNQVSDLAIVIDKNNNYNIVDSSGNKKLRDNYTYIEYFNNNYFIVTKDSKTGVIDGNGNVLINLEYDAIQEIDDTNALQAIKIDDNRTDIIDSNMNIHEGIANANVLKKDNYIKVFSETEMKYYDFSGNEITYKSLFPNNSLYASQSDGKWGLVNNNGTVVVPYEYDMVTEQNGNVAGVKKDGVWQVVDANGQIVSDGQFNLSWLDVTFLGGYYKVNNSTNGTVYSGTVQN